jgi:hypothetical protein
MLHTPKAFIDSSFKLTANLACRWADECKHEDIAEYKDVIARAAAPYGVKIGRMVKRPFGFFWTLGKERFRTVTRRRGSSAIVATYRA